MQKSTWYQRRADKAMRTALTSKRKKVWLVRIWPMWLWFGFATAGVAAQLPITFSPAHSLGVLNPSGPVVFNTDPYASNAPGRVVVVFNTAGDTNAPDGYPVRVFDFDAINLQPGSSVIATGSGPLILVSGSDVAVHGLIDLNGAAGASNTNGGGGGGAGGGSLAMFANGSILVGSAGQILAQGGDGGLGLAGTGDGTGGHGRADGWSGGDGGASGPGGNGGKGGGSSDAFGNGGGGGGGGAFRTVDAGRGGLGGSGGWACGNKGGNGSGASFRDANLRNGASGGGGGKGAGGGGGNGGGGGSGGGQCGQGANGGNGSKGTHPLFKCGGGGGGGGGGGAWGGKGGDGKSGVDGGGGGGGGGGADGAKSCTTTVYVPGHWEGHVWVPGHYVVNTVTIPPGKGGQAGNGGSGGADGSSLNTAFRGQQSGLDSSAESPSGDGSSEPHGGAGGGGACVLGSVVDQVEVNGLVSLRSGAAPGQPPDTNNLGWLVVYGNLVGNTNRVEARVAVTTGSSQGDWYIMGGGGGGGGAGSGLELDEAQIATIPTLSEWGLIILALLLLITGTLYLRWKNATGRHPAAA